MKTTESLTSLKFTHRQVVEKKFLQVKFGTSYTYNSLMDRSVFGSQLLSTQERCPEVYPCVENISPVIRVGGQS